MGDDVPKKLQYGQWFLRMLMGAFMFAGLLWFGSGHTTTVEELTKVIASTNFLIVLGAELLDKFTDRSTYEKLYGGFYKKAWSGQENNALGKILSPIIVSALIFMITLYLIAGSLTFSLGAYSPAVVLWAGFLATYIMLPETGDDELVLWIWLGATIATKGAYLGNALAGFHIVGHVLALLLPGF